MKLLWDRLQSGAALTSGWSGGFLVALLLWAAPIPLVAAAPPPLQYNRDVRPLLSDQCFLCHGPDKNTRKGKLRLDQRDEPLARKAIVPGHPEESRLIQRLFSDNPEEVMPPPDSHKSLTAAQKNLLKRWVAEGAEYQPHWAYVKPLRGTVPVVRHPKLVRNPIDAFIVAALESQGRRPSPEADRRTLLRRLSLDLLGLPPTPAELRQFEADREPLAYERQVERLLNSPHYGERMAVPWLDSVRFSDTVGYHGDQNQRIFPYRDYVIASFNRNKSFRDFTVEQLAGDLLPQPTVEQRVATGFNRLNMMTREGGAQPKEYLAKYASDRVRTVAITWLGSTMGCAECHDHKFDPFTSRDFYSMAAFFSDVQQWGVYADYKYTPNPDLTGWSNEHPFPPELEVESDYLKARSSKLRDERTALLEAAATDFLSQERFTRWLNGTRSFLDQHPTGWVTLSPELPMPPVAAGAVATNAVAATNASARSLVAEPAGAVRVQLGGKVEEVRVELPLPSLTLAAFRLERLSGDAEEKLGPGEQARGLRMSAVHRREGKETKISFYRADADRKEPRYANGQELIGIVGGWRPDRAHSLETQTAVWLPESPLSCRTGDTLVVTLRAAGPLVARFAISPLAADQPLQAGADAGLRAALDREPEARSTSQRLAVVERFLLSAFPDASRFARYKKLQREILECRDGHAWTLVTAAWKPPVTRVLPRGNWQNESGEVVTPAPPRFLLAGARARPEGWTRLDLARWLVSRDNPLTARVTVNRLWKQFFGAGLSQIVDDLGSQGDWPVQAGLLDWLAVEFMDPVAAVAGTTVAAQPWDIKHVVRLIVTSATYRQVSNLRPELSEIDPQNRWFAAQNPRRLEAEFVRDNALFVAGLLNPDLGGPSVRPYQPSGYYEALQFPDREYVAQDDDRQYRRGVYMHWQRTFLHPMLANFDAPSREECTATRNVSNTPQQALTLLNDPSFIEAARVLAAHTIDSPGLTDRARIEQIFEHVLGRLPKAREVASLTRFAAEQRAHFATHPDEAHELGRVGFAPPPPAAQELDVAAWTQVCRALLNTHESITRY